MSLDTVSAGIVPFRSRHDDTRCPNGREPEGQQGGREERQHAGSNSVHPRIMPINTGEKHRNRQHFATEGSHCGPRAMHGILQDALEHAEDDPRCFLLTTGPYVALNMTTHVERGK